MQRGTTFLSDEPKVSDVKINARLTIDSKENVNKPRRALDGPRHRGVWGLTQTVEQLMFN